MIALVEKTMGQSKAEALSRFLRTTAHRQEARVKAQLKTALPFLAVSILLGFLLVIVSTYTFCYTVTIGDMTLAYAGQPEVIEKAVETVEAHVSDILGKDYEMASNITYSLAVANKDDVLGYTKLEDTLYSIVPEIKAAYVLTIDGIEVGLARDKAELETVMSTIEQSFVTENTVTVAVLNEIDMVKDYVGLEKAYQTAEEMLSVLLHSSQTMSLTVDDVEAATVSQEALPIINVSTTERVEYTTIVESPVREIKDNTVYMGDSEIVITGTAGENYVVADVTKVNGEETERTVIKETVITEPSQTVVAVGTLIRPTYYSTGTLIMPCEGIITSDFGYRYIFDSTSFHSGVDIASSEGTAIYASDSGVVTFAEYDGTYGNLVIIDHGNGWETYYAHCSELLVEEGDSVKQGMQIATMGQTGRATGVHCHWELQIDGVQVNALDYM